MKRYSPIFYIFLLLLIANNSFATWSIIVIDQKTRQIGIAGASCTYSVYGIGGIIPERGAIVVQAMSNKLAKREGLKMILAGASPDVILKALLDPEFEPEEQQYAIVCIEDMDKPAVYTGKETPTHKGALTAKGIAVQGNTLSSATTLQAVLAAALQAQEASLPLEEVLMRALEAGATAGGDSRCGQQKASSSFLTIANPEDDYNHPYLNLIVNGQENEVNAVDVLRKKLTAWTKKQDD